MTPFDVPNADTMRARQKLVLDHFYKRQLYLLQRPAKLAT
jgi:hypothetical protein